MATLDTAPVVGSGGGVYVNTADSPAPATLADLTGSESTWKYLGLISEDGVTYQPLAEETEDMNVWQLAFPWDVVTTSQSSTLAFALAQWNRDTINFVFAGGTWDDTGDMATFTPPRLGETSNTSVCLHVATSSGHHIVVYYRRARVTEREDATINKSEMSTLGVTVTMLGIEGEDPQKLMFDTEGMPVATGTSTTVTTGQNVSSGQTAATGTAEVQTKAKGRTAA